MSRTPSPNGRDARGRFGRGNTGGPGNPYAASVARLRTALIEAVTPEDVAAIARALVAQAKAGDVAAVRELMNRLMGPPVELDLIERLERLERAQEARGAA